MSKKPVAELPEEARPLVRGYAIEELREFNETIHGYLKLYFEHYSEFERTQLRRVALDASRLADIIETRN